MIKGVLIEIWGQFHNFINILQADFGLRDPESAKKTYNLTVFFALLGSACVKAAHKRLVKLTPARDTFDQPFQCIKLVFLTFR